MCLLVSCFIKDEFAHPCTLCVVFLMLLFKVLLFFIVISFVLSLIRCMILVTNFIFLKIDSRPLMPTLLLQLLSPIKNTILSCDKCPYLLTHDVWLIDMLQHLTNIFNTHSYVCLANSVSPCCIFCHLLLMLYLISFNTVVLKSLSRTLCPMFIAEPLWFLTSFYGI
jgi:hypothetical protein